ncbi:MAG: hypothetical protein P4L36_06560 [Holophaga sp.]|nr:hypothetical protein [Holophaga sp.]
MRLRLYAAFLLLGSLTFAPAQVRVGIGIGLPNVSIGIHLGAYPSLAPVPGYPVYYAPAVNGNYFFYDGMYWVLQDDGWFTSSWYNGPWAPVPPESVPVYLLRVPVQYYRRPPVYFRGWRPDAPPRWGEHWGPNWAQRRPGWDQWDRHAAPPRAQLPDYQRRFQGDRYPRAEQQQALHSQNYHYEPREPVVREHYRSQQGRERVP